MYNNIVYITPLAMINVKQGDYILYINTIHQVHERGTIFNIPCFDRILETYYAREDGIKGNLTHVTEAVTDPKHRISISLYRYF